MRCGTTTGRVAGAGGFALGILLAAALLRRVAASFSPGSALFWLGSSPMAAWLSGWACGFASMKAMRGAGELLIGFDELVRELFILLKGSLQIALPSAAGKKGAKAMPVSPDNRASRMSKKNGPFRDP